jgi:hypothetical protein
MSLLKLVLNVWNIFVMKEENEKKQIKHEIST